MPCHKIVIGIHRQYCCSLALETAVWTKPFPVHSDRQQSTYHLSARRSPSGFVRCVTPSKNLAWVVQEFLLCFFHLTCSWDRASGRDDTIQVTTSLHGGVVRDPRYVTYCEEKVMSSISREKGRARVTSNSAPTTASRKGMMPFRAGFGRPLSCNV